MPKVGIIAKLTARQGRRDALVREMEQLFSVVEAEEGTEIYSVHLDETDPDAVWFFEMYTDKAALRAHATNDAVRGLASTLAPLLSKDTEIVQVTPLRAKGIPL